MRSARHILFALFAFFAAVTAANADVVIDRGSEIVMPTNAPYATRLAAEELNFFLKGVLGEALPVVAQRTEGKTAIVLGGASGDRALPDHDGYVVEARSNVLRIFGNDDDVSDVDATAALPDEAIWQPCFRRGTLFGVYAFLERFAGVRMYFPGALGTCIPKTARIVVTEGCVEESPAFSVRRYGYADGSVAKELLDDQVGRDAPIAPLQGQTERRESRPWQTQPRSKTRRRRSWTSSTRNTRTSRRR